MKQTVVLLGLVLALAGAAGADSDDALHAGPLLGPTTQTSAWIWVQTRREVEVQLRYHPEGQPAAARLTEPRRTGEAEDHTLSLQLRGLAAGTAYRYELYLDGERVTRPYPLGFRTRRPARGVADLTILLGSCAFVADPGEKNAAAYEETYAIFETMAEVPADAMLWLGDNVYLRRGEEFSPGSIGERYRRTRGLRQLQALWAATPHYAIWDDHDFGPNDSDGTFPLRADSLRVFQRYWPGRPTGLPEAPGVFRRTRLEDVTLFLLDDRYHRSPNAWPAGPDKRCLGRDQLDWLKASLLAARSAFKLVVCGNQLLNDATRFESLAHLFPDELAELLAWIETQRIEGVVFVSGDRHRSELLRLERPGGYPLYEITCSPLSARAHGFREGDPEATNPLRVKGTMVPDRNFGVLQVLGPRRRRRLVIQMRDRAGQMLWERTITREELCFPDGDERPRRKLY